MEKLLDYIDDVVLDIIPNKDVLSDLEIDLENPEINIEEMAIRLGCNINYKYLFSETFETDGYNEETKEIIVDLFDPEYRQRFTIAYGLAHHLLVQNGMTYRDYNSDEYYINYMLREQKVNKLAARILMPEKIIEYILANIGITEDMVKFLAEKFNVSYTAMGYRLILLKKISLKNRRK